MDKRHLIVSCNTVRAKTYHWFATLLAQELTEPQLQAFTSKDSRRFLHELAEELGQKGLVVEQRMLKNLSWVHEGPFPVRSLARQYTDAFLCAAGRSALPYASAYLSESGLLFQKPHAEMLDLLKQSGAPSEEGRIDGADHVAIMLDYMGTMIEQTQNADEETQAACERKQLEFIDEFLLNWIPDFGKRCRKTNEGFYGSLCTLLELFVASDRNKLVQSIS